MEVRICKAAVAFEQSRAQLASATSELENADTAFRRREELAKTQSVSEPIGDDARNRPTIAEASLRAEFAGAEHTWDARIVRTEGELDPRTRMINMIAQVPRPYEPAGSTPALIVGLFVQAGEAICLSALDAAVEGQPALPITAAASS